VHTVSVLAHTAVAYHCPETVRTRHLLASFGISWGRNAVTAPIVANVTNSEIVTIGVLWVMYNLGELNPLEGVDGEGPVAGYSADPTTWDPNNLLGRYHLWRITSKFPVPGTAVMNDLRRRNRLTTAAEKDAEAAVIRQNFEKREEALEWVSVVLSKTPRGRY
jgi:hypothetical protein